MDVVLQKEQEVFLQSAIADLEISKQLMSHLREANIHSVKDLNKSYIESKKEKKFMKELELLFISKGIALETV